MKDAIDQAALVAVCDFVRARAQSMERRKMFWPLADALQQQMGAVQQLLPELLAEPEINVRRSTLALEQSLAELDGKREDAVRRMDAALEATRQRTASLHRWLESLP